MSSPALQAEHPSAAVIPQPRLRLWPGVVILTLLWTIRTLATLGPNSPTKFMWGLLATPMICLLLVQLWWMFGSRLKLFDRLSALGTFVAVTTATILIAGADFPVMALMLYASPIVVSVWVGWLILTQKLSWRVRQVGLLLMLVATGAFFSSVRFGGVDGDFNAEFNWRWNRTAEQKMMAELKETVPAVIQSNPTESKSVKALELVLQPGDWPEFRGLHRDNRVSGVRIQTDWGKAPPKELWKHRIGPGWSSFAVIGERLFTQEQRGDDEYVVCYNAQTGGEIWAHHDAGRFFEVIAGAGPRSTPTFYEGRIFALGASGRLNCLDALTGKPLWSHDIVEDSGAKIPMWGFSSSPLVVNGLVTVFAGGVDDKGVLAYHTDSGKLAWAAKTGVLSYCSTQLATIDGVEQLLMISEMGIFALNPETGAILWQHEWPSEGAARVVQPALIGKSDILIGTGMGIGTRRISVKHVGDKWESTEGWTSRAFKPYYNDFVVSGEYLYGFDGSIFMCVNLDDGSIKWRTRGYGNGQVLLLTEQKLLLVLTEQGEVVLVEAQSDKHQETGRFKALEGKTWNHPVVAHGKLFVRNGEEAACFELKTISGEPKIAVK
jgi:outer membrane protein assembly factor BamB